ncbi:unnamed protein product [Rotaria sp. Silwood1]|nr:unnamed protein product [Rotaria sp. Silwood1]
MNKKHTSLPPPLPTFVLRSFSSGVTCIKYDLTDSLRLYTGEQQGTVHLYNLRSRQPILSLSNAHTSTILGLSQLIENNKLITFSKDGFVKLWNESGQCQWDYQTNHCSFSNCDIISPNLIVVPIGGDDNSTVVALDSQCSNPIIKKFIPITTNINHGMIMKLRIYDNRWLFVAYECGSLNVFDVITTKQLDTYQITSDHEPITAMDVICNTCLCGTTKSDLISLDFSSLKLQPTSTFRHIEMPNAGTSFIRCRPDDGKLIAVAGWDSRIRLFRRETGKQLAMLDLHRQQVNSIDFDLHTRQMACASEDRTILFISTSIQSPLSPSEIELITRVHAYFSNNNPTKFFCFYENTSPFNNFYSCNVIENGIQFHCSEQYMMYHKAKLFNDDDIARKILDAKKSAKCKGLGRKVKSFNEQTWMDNRTKIVSDGIYLKSKFSFMPWIKITQAAIDV